jgi:putative oxidoreductase
MMPRNKMITAIDWVCRITAAIIMVQTLYFKFSGAEESVYIFTKMGMEPWGRYGTGSVELVASVLYMTPRFAWLGALLSIGVMLGAIASHLTVLGIVVKNDGGLLFGLALTVFVCGVIVAYLHRQEIPFVSQFLSSAITGVKKS